MAAALLLFAGGDIQARGREIEHSSAPAPPRPSEKPSLPPLVDYERPVTDCGKKKCVALTFDDGPGPGTDHLLDLLAASGARVTFFVIGPEAQKFPDTVLREAMDGHEVGNHTLHHLQLTKFSAKTVHHEIDGTSRILEGILGFRPTLFRPPYGATNARVAREARDGKLAEIIWSVDTDDWRDRDAAIVARRAIRGMHPGAIILMHDIHPTTIAAVPRILKAAKEKGYTLATVTDVLGGAPKAGRVYMGR